MENFNQGLIDWRKVLNMAHWLVLSSSGSLGGQSMKSALGSAMTFAELEGCKTVMIVEPPGEPERLEEAWGNVIERIRQIQVLYLSQDVIDGISSLEGTEAGVLIQEVRERSLVPIVCTFNQENGIVIVSHSLGEETIEISSGIAENVARSSRLCREIRLT